MYKLNRNQIAILESLDQTQQRIAHILISINYDDKYSCLEYASKVNTRRSFFRRKSVYACLASLFDENEASFIIDVYNMKSYISHEIESQERFYRD